MRSPTSLKLLSGPAAAALLLSALPASAQTGLHVTEYKFNDPRYLTMGLDGLNPTVPFVLPTADWLPLGLEVDPAAGQVYWSHGGFNDGRIRRANLDGSGQQLLVSGLKLVRGLALDLAGGKMYWANSPAAGNAGGIIERANLDGTQRELVYAITPYDPVSSKIGRPTVDAANGWVWFGANDRVLRVNLDGPPFVARTAVTGLSTPTRVAVDVAGGWVYGIDSDTISDCVWRARFDNREFSVVHDATPNSIVSSGLLDLIYDRTNPKLYFADEISQLAFLRCDPDGANVEVIRATPAGWSPAAMCFDQEPPQALEDRNHNGVRDLDDVAGGTSADCNVDGVPDEAQGADPCGPEPVLHDQPLNLAGTQRALGGSPGWRVFQPFDVPAGGWVVGELRFDGVTQNHVPGGFTATLFPDDGTGTHPDETQPIASGSAVFRFAHTPVGVVLDVALPPGRHWARLTANASYAAGVHVASSGLASFSRNNAGSEFAGPPIALRVLEATRFEGYCAGDGSATACPCANLGADGRGCANSAPTFGGLLSASGLASVSQDGVVLTASGLPQTSTVIFLQGTVAANGGLGVALGDGLRCVAGSLIRLGVKSAVGGSVSYPQPGDASVSVRGMLPPGGGTWYYQGYYRDPAAFCTGDTFNWTNGLAGAWLP